MAIALSSPSKGMVLSTRTASLSPPSSLGELASPPPLNRSFSTLARLIGLGGAGTKHIATSEPDSDAEDADEGVEPVDEDKLMWDAQTALIDHQTHLAESYFTAAALPPHRSPAACLALSSLIARSPAIEAQSPGLGEMDKGTLKGKGKEIIPRHHRRQSTDTATLRAVSPSTTIGASKFFGTFFSSPPSATPIASPDVRPTPGRSSSKRVIRDADRMGKAGGWLVLGIGWVIEHQVERERISRTVHTHQPQASIIKQDDDVLVFNPKTRAHRRSPPISSPPLPTEETVFRALSKTSSTSTSTADLSSADTGGTTVASDIIKTPGVGSSIDEDDRDPVKLLIQSQDAVALPSISPGQLPFFLRPGRDVTKRKNAWYLGNVVARRVKNLALLRRRIDAKERDEKEREHQRIGVLVMAEYIDQAAAHFRSIISIGHCGYESIDDLVRHASARLEIIGKSEPNESVCTSPLLSSIIKAEYPFPSVLSRHERQYPKRSPSTEVSFHRNPSIFSFADSTYSTSRVLQTPVKSTTSLAQLCLDAQLLDKPEQVAEKDGKAVDHLRRMDHGGKGEPRWGEGFRNWLSRSSPPNETSAVSAKPISKSASIPAVEPFPEPVPPSLVNLTVAPPLRTAASSPVLSTPISKIRASTQSTNSLRNLLPQQHDIAPIDPVLAAAELASSLTKQAVCGVCGTKGINFPECRRCGLVFCSRDCRVGEDKAGNGKR
ncbi:hypothetical protein P7C73_g5212, partial [Tremellales sp. Uapishka_1]